MLSKRYVICLFITFGIYLQTCSQNKTSQKSTMETTSPNTSLEVATLGGGCFWCVEAIFQRIKGVVKVESGYAGGTTENPTYQAVCTGTTGHAEVCQITFDKNQISYMEILEVFFGTHDPTTPNRQGNDVGPQYRSIILYHNEEQKQIAQKVIQTLTQEKVFPNPIVTEVVPFTKFYKAEQYHQNYYNNNPMQGYCYFVIRPKLEKLQKVFKEKLKQ